MRYFWLSVLFLVILLLVFAFGYHRGVSGVTRSVDTVYYGDTVHFSWRGVSSESVVGEVSYSPHISIPRFLFRTDTLYSVDSVYHPSFVDTLGVVRDYFTRRGYLLDFSSDSVGVFRVHCVVRENRLDSVRAEVVPLVRYIEKTVPLSHRSLGSWVSLSAGVHDFGLDGGVRFMDRYRLGLGYRRHFNGSMFDASSSDGLVLVFGVDF